MWSRHLATAINWYANGALTSAGTKLTVLPGVFTDAGTKLLLSPLFAPVAQAQPPFTTSPPSSHVFEAGGGCGKDLAQRWAQPTCSLQPFAQQPNP